MTATTERRRASTNGAASEQPVIQVSDRRLNELTADAIAALEPVAEDMGLYVRGGLLVRVRSVEDDGDRPIIEPTREPHVRGACARAAIFKRGDNKCSPPLDMVQDIIGLPEWPFLPLLSVTETPFVRRDGTIVLEPGYDAATRVLLWDSPGLSQVRVPENPSSDDAAAAVALLEEVVCDFPFVDDGRDPGTSASRANALGLFITPIVREAIPGHVPLALLDATVQGTGKGLLAKVLSIIAWGRERPFTVAPEREEEMQKTLFALLVGGTPLIVLDEAQRLSSRTLSGMLTMSPYEGRVLGMTATVAAPQRAVWAATGNNLRPIGDMIRRTYWIRQDAELARPWLRTESDFRHPDLLRWVTANRARILSAILTLAQAWNVAGQPPFTGHKLGSFEEWCEVVGGILEHAGIDGFLENSDQLYDLADDDGAEWEGFLSAWRDDPVIGREPVTSGALSAHISATEALREVLPSELAEHIGEKGSDKGFAVSLGKQLSSRLGRRFGSENLHVEVAGHEGRSKVKRWKVVRAEAPPPPVGDQDDVRSLEWVKP